jgi:hypothetical protein
MGPDNVLQAAIGRNSSLPSNYACIDLTASLVLMETKGRLKGAAIMTFVGPNWAFSR